MKSNHTRLPPSMLVELSNILVAKDRRSDRQFMRLYENSLLGKIDVSLTRLDEETITSGFYERSENVIRHHTNYDRTSILKAIVSLKSGTISPIFVYWNAHNPSSEKWVCPDDEVVLAAYRELKFKFVPCIILLPKEIPRVHGAVWLRGENNPAYRKTVRGIPKSTINVFFDDDSEVSNGFERSIAECSAAISLIEKYYPNIVKSTSYYEMLGCTVQIHTKNLLAIQMLLDKELYEQAVAILRMMYEGYLNFYLDWLSPEFFGPRLQYMSMIGFSSAAKDKETIGSLYKLLGSVENKARLSNLGEDYYRSNYKFFSDIVHQSYSFIENPLSDGNEPDDPSSLQKSIILNCDYLTIELLRCVRNDIGDGSYFG
jgi:hypothetical protein